MYQDPDLANLLKPGQLAAASSAMLPRRKLGRGTLVLLLALRVYVMLAIPVVGYAFIRALNAGP